MPVAVQPGHAPHLGPQTSLRLPFRKRVPRRRADEGFPNEPQVVLEEFLKYFPSGDVIAAVPGGREPGEYLQSNSYPLCIRRPISAEAQKGRARSDILPREPHAVVNCVRRMLAISWFSDKLGTRTLRSRTIIRSNSLIGASKTVSSACGET